jgi:hypothetical protein
MDLKYHKSLTFEKWQVFPFYKQILMIANELNRAGVWIQKNDFAETHLCYARALELVYLTEGVLKQNRLLAEFLRFKEMLCLLYSQESPDKEFNDKLMRALIMLDTQSFNLLNA